MDFDKVKENARLTALSSTVSPIPENNASRGRACTQSRNVYQAKPLLREHYKAGMKA
jgi:hypothetical protein